LLQVRAALFGPVVHGLAECAALRYITPEDPLWQQAAAGLTSIVQAGLPAVNIMFVNYAQQPENAWQVLADAFETFLLGEGLPEGLVPSQQQQQQRSMVEQTFPHSADQQQQRQLQHSGSDVGTAASSRQSLAHSSSSTAGAAESGSSSAAAAAASAAAAALQRSVLDMLTEQVLTSCSSAAHEQRSRLVRVVVVGAGSSLGHCCSSVSSSLVGSSVMFTSSSSSNASARPGRVVSPVSPGTAAAACGAVCVAPDQRFSQICLRRLALLASRGTEGQAGSMNAVLLEVAQIALPQLIERCRAVLQAYCQVEQVAAAQELQELVRNVAQLGARGATSMQQQQLGQQQQQQPGEPLQQQQQQQQQGMHVQQEQAAAAASLAECAVTAAIQQQQPPQEGADCASSMQLQQQCLVEEVLCVLHVLLDLQLDAAVFDYLVEREPSLAACLGVVQHAQQVQEHLQHQQQQQQPAHSSSPKQQQVHQLGQKQGVQQAGVDAQRRNSSSSTQGTASAAAAAAGGAGECDSSSQDEGGPKHQGHLLLLYKELAACAGCRDRRVGVLVRAALQAVGRQLAL
jgi:hypothetical protein